MMVTQIMYLTSLQAARRVYMYCYEPESKGQKGKILLYHDNAKPHIATRTTDYLEELGMELLDPPTHSPDLSPCHFFFFKDKMLGLMFSSPNMQQN